MRPIIEVHPSPAGYSVFKCGYPIMDFAGEDEARNYADELLSDLRYEAER